MLGSSLRENLNKMELLRGGIRPSENNAGHWVGWQLYGLAFTCLFYFHSFLGLPDHVCASFGHHWAHYLLLHQQHGSSGNSGHVSTWCLRLLAGGKTPTPLSPFPHYSSFFTFPPKNWLSPQLNSYLPFSRQPSWPIMPSISVSVTPFLWSSVLFLWWLV